MSTKLRPRHLGRYGQFARLLVKYGREDFVRTSGLEDMSEHEVADQAKPEALTADLEALGPTFIKLGQLLSTRADLLPPPYLVALSRLQDDVAPFPYDDVRETVEENLGVRISNAFSRFDTEPVASASLGQVHRAALRDGRPVAVKVQRPDVRRQVTTDMEALEELAAFVDRHTKWAPRYGLAEMMRQFRESLFRELDYRIEAQNLRRLAENLAGFDRIVVPLPVDDFTSERVLTMEFIGGQKISDVGPLGMMEVDAQSLAEELFRAYLKQILQDGFFHADPHPGNVFITDDGRLGLLDLGMVATVEPGTQDQLVKLLLAVTERRPDDAADALSEIGERTEEYDEARFRNDIKALISDNAGLSIENLQAGVLVAEMSRVSVEAGLRPAPDLAMFGKALLNLDDVARRLDPDFDPDEALAQEAASLLRRRMVSSVSPGRLFAATLEAKEFAERLPGRVNKVIDALAEGELRLRVDAIDERELMRAAQKVANRVTTGVVLAALVIGASMLMRVDTKFRILDYPALAMICFLAAAGGGFALLIAILINDRRR